MHYVIIYIFQKALSFLKLDELSPLNARKHKYQKYTDDFDA